MEMVDHGNRMTLGQCHELVALSGEEGVRLNDQRASMQFGESGKGAFDFDVTEGLENGKHRPFCVGGVLHVPDRPLGIGIGWLTSKTIDLLSGTSSEINSRRFAVSSLLSKLTPVRLPPGRDRLATSPSPTGSALTKAMGIVEVARLAANAGGAPPPVTITSIDLAIDELSGQC